ncbi:unnamed protein product [Rotaria sordida]|uniref:CAP-Gly domain-containing protein n=2 Tax=Rotaria sordida TaxID=392033 RepID=A0A815CIV6_9BILA|nr:unnamed protein product [Rotaria sordida]CAF3596264.1 unnamed protein product [Rotaria sordida]
MSKLPTSRLPVTPKNVTTTKSGLRPPQQTSTTTTTTTISSQQASPTSGDSSNNQLTIGDRVIANGKSGAVAFIGPTKFADGEWIGIILDEAQGKNDGSYEGTRYFETEPNRGLFCRSTKVQRLTQNGATSNSDTSGPVKQQTIPLTDTLKSSTSISNSDKGEDADTTLIDTTTAADTSTTTNDQTVLTEPSSIQGLVVGDRVVVSGTKYGTLKYLGKIHVAEGIWCGIQLDEPLGKNDGSVSGKRYFTCQQRYGLFSPLARVEKVTNDMSQSQIVGRKASVSSSTNNNRQLQRSTSQESLHSNLSEFSTSSNSISRIPTRTPAKNQQQKLSTNTNVYTTPNTKTLLTQAAATLAAATPSSNQMSNLVQIIKDKDIFIEKLQLQREQDRLEFSRAAQQVDEMESRLLAFKQQYDIKILENEELKKDQYQTKQRLEDLEFQLEEYKLTDANKDNLITSTIPDGYRLLSPNEIEIYEQIKGKLVESESINQKLTLEKQTLQDEHRQELKRQNELNENDFKTRFNELEQKYNNNLKINQTENIDLIKSEYELKLNNQNKQLNDIIEQIKKDRQQEIDQLKLQINDFQNQEQTKTNTLSEKETFYQQQLKEQQSKIQQSINEAQEVQSQLTKSQQEKEASEKQVNDLLVELKRYQETIVPDLEKQNQTLKIDIQNRDQSANSTLTERESHYEQQIKEYQSNIAQAINETEKIRTELKQIQEENISKEKQTNDLINTLKQDYEKQCEKLQNDLTELNNREQKLNTTFNERESHYEQQIKDYQNKLDQSTHEIQTVQSELIKLQEEKTINEKKSIDTINTLKQDYERQYEILKTELTELQDRDRTQNMALNEREAHYEMQIKEYQTKRDQAIRETQDLRNELTKLQEEKTSNEKQLNDSINKLKQDFEKQIESSQIQITELENQNRTKTNEFNEKDQQFKEYQSKLDQLNRENNELRQQIEHNQQANEIKLNQLKQEFDEKHQTNEQTQNESIQRTENLTKECENLKQINETLKQDSQDLQNKYNDLQNEYEKYSTSNEQLKNTNDNIVNEKQALIDQLTKQINHMQQVQAELIEKQISQHADFERQHLEDKQIHEKLLKEKTDEYESKMQSMKSQYLIETENSNLEHEQEKIRLKHQLQQAVQGVENKNDSSSTGHVKQLEYESVEARYQIERLQKQIEANSTKDDRATLEGQINFLNDVIIDLRNTNERLKKEIEFQKNPFVQDDELLENTTTTRRKSSIPRLYCDMCEVFDEHDTDDCPKQSSMIDDQPPHDHHSHERVIPPPRLYCEKCEEFGHDCNEVDETY